MNELTLTTPAILFPAISLLLLAYTNRYVAISNRIRTLHAQYSKEKSSIILEQIKILKLRIRLIRDMQLMGILSMLFASLTMFLIFEKINYFAGYIFGVSLVLLIVSLAFSAYEIMLSNKALLILLTDIEEEVILKENI
ncbi:MAG: DUF2721 domain-containing protein [Cytophagales bacterium]